MSALDDRRRAALEAWSDSYSAPDTATLDALDAAIDSATRVRITPELLATMDPAIGNRETRLRAAFEAAGFEVVE